MVRSYAAGTALAVLTTLASGCTMRTQVRNAAGDAGTLRSYAVPFDQVRQAALDALSATSLPLAEEWWIDRSRWSALGAPARGLAPARVARIVVEDHPTDCRVWTLVQSKSKLIDEAAAGELHVQIAKALGLESRAEPTPVGGAGEREDRYRAPIGRCSELATRACRARGFEVVRIEESDAALKTITAEKKPSRRLFAAFYRHSESVTRVVVEVRGGAPDENREDASAVHEELQKELPLEK